MKFSLVGLRSSFTSVLNMIVGFLPSPMCTHLLVGVGGETRMKAACYETS